MAAGDFTATQLGDIVAEVQEIFLGERHKQGIRKKTDAAQRILENQQVNLTPLYRGGLDDNNNCIGFEVTQLKNCDTTVDDCDITSCTLDGIEIESVAEQYTPNVCKTIGRKALGKLCSNRYTKEMLIAKQIADALQLMDQNLQTLLLTHIIAEAQENRAQADGPGTWDSGDNAMVIDPEKWSADLIGDILYNAEANDLFDLYAITGRNFQRDFWRSRFGGCDDCDASIFDDAGLPIIFAGPEFDRLAGFPATAVVDAGSIAYFNMTDFQNESPELFSPRDGLYGWRVPSPNLRYNNNGVLTPVFYDVMIQDVCAADNTNNRRVLDTAVEVKHTGGIITAPATCEEDDTGILLFAQGEEGGGGDTNGG